MHTAGFDIQNRLLSVGGPATGPFGNERQRISFIQQPKFALRIFGRGRIQVNTAFQQIPVKIGHQRTDLAGGIVLLLASGQVISDGLVVKAPVAFIAGVDGARCGGAQVRVRQQVLAN